MTGCCANHCTNSDIKGFKMFRVPLDPKRRKIWLEKINKKNWFAGPGSALCQIHFEDSMFECINGKKCLKRTAIPTVFTKSNVAPKKKMNHFSLKDKKKTPKNDKQQVVVSAVVTNAIPVTNQTIDYIVINTVENVVSVGVTKQLTSQRNNVSNFQNRKRSSTICYEVSPTESSET